jgi:ABC-type Na+ efflux pump permease subunit
MKERSMERLSLNRITRSLYTAWTIASKDILEVLRNKSTLANLLLLLGFVVFFYWASTLRPFDQRIEVVVYGQGDSGLEIEDAELEDGTSFIFQDADSLEEMKRLLRYEHLGVVLPADFDQRLAAGEVLDLSGYIMWAHRPQVSELETEYSEKFSALLDNPVQIEISEDFVVPPYDLETSMAQLTVFYVILWAAVSLIPHLMLEERWNKTLDALLVSPAGPGEVVLGKALAGLFYILVLSIWFFVFYWAYVSHWGLVLLGFLLTALFCVGIGLLIGNLIQNPQQLGIAGLVVAVTMLLPAIFAQEPFLNATLKAIFTLLPSAALVYLIRLSFSGPAPLSALLFNLGIAVVSIAVVYAIIVWQVRRSDR